MRNLRWPALALAAIVAIPVLAFPQVVAWRLKASLSNDLHAQSVRVSLRGGLTSAVTGRFSRFALDARRGVGDGLPFDILRAEFTDVDLDVGAALRRGELVVTRVGGGEASITLTEEDVQRYLADAKGVAGARVRLAGGVVAVGGNITILTHQIDVQLRGRLVTAPRQVSLRVDMLSISGLALPPEIANALVASVNPLLTADQLPLPVRFTGADVADGRLHVTAVPVP